MSTIVILGTINPTNGMPLYLDTGGSRLRIQAENDPPYIRDLALIIEEHEYSGLNTEDNERSMDEDVHHRRRHKS